MTDQMVSALQQSLRGRVIGPGEVDYDAARALYNGMIDKRPRLIARCVDVADVIAAVNFGRDQGLLVAIRGGGHNGPGLGSCDDGLVIDLSLMKSVPWLVPSGGASGGGRGGAFMGTNTAPAADGQHVMARLLESVPPPIFN